MGHKNGELCFTRTDGALSARMFIKHEWHEARSVEVKPGHVDVVVQGPLGEATISADYSVDAMTGSLEARFGNRPFRAQKK